MNFFLYKFCEILLRIRPMQKLAAVWELRDGNLIFLHFAQYVLIQKVPFRIKHPNYKGTLYMLNLGKLSICIYEEEKRRIVSPGSLVQSLYLFCHHLHCLSNFGFSSHPGNKSSAGVLHFCHLKHGVCGVGALSMMSWIILMIMFSTYFQMLHRKNNCQVLQYEFNILTQSEKTLQLYILCSLWFSP